MKGGSGVARHARRRSSSALAAVGAREALALLGEVVRDA
jgi:hypothetical protein